MVKDEVTCQCFFGPDVLLCTRVSADDDSNRVTNSKKKILEFVTRANRPASWSDIGRHHGTAS